MREILIKQESIPALGHTFTWEYDGDIHTGTCSVCGGVESHIGDYEEIETHTQVPSTAAQPLNANTATILIPKTM